MDYRKGPYLLKDTIWMDINKCSEVARWTSESKKEKVNKR